MHERRFGSSERTVGAIGLGCMGMSWAYGEAEREDAVSESVVRQALDLGVTLIDTADVYGPFHNEELVGRALAGRRDEAMLATKCGLVVEPATRKISMDGRPEHIRSACDASLARLGTDRIDLYQLHRVDPQVPVEESWGAMSELVAAGKVTQLGISEAGVDMLERCGPIWPVASVQSELSLWTRGPLDAVLPWCEQNGAAFLPFAPLGRGFLTGTLDPAGGFDATDIRSRNPRFTAEALAANQALLSGVQQVADDLGVTRAQVALAWTLAQSPVVLPIPGTKKPHYLAENAAAADIVLDREHLDALDALPAAVGSRY